MNKHGVYLIFFGLLLGCGNEPSPLVPYQARILASGEDGYQFQNVTLNTLYDLSRVKGDLAEVKGGAILDIEDDVTEIIGTDNPDAIYSDRGSSVNINYIVKGGVIHPKDFSSMAALAIYHNYEKTFLYWQDTFGLTLDEFGLTTIYDNPKLKASGEGISIEAQVKVNAAFLTGVRDLWFFKKSRLANVPIKMNFGVMAHEFAHSIFDLLVAQKDPAFYDGSTLDEYKLSAINEGLADFFSILVTGRTSEFSASLPSLGEERTPPVSWTMKTVNSSCFSSFYCEGSILNSALIEAGAITGNQSMGTYVVSSFPQFRDDWIANRNQGTFGYHHLLNHILDETPAQYKTEVCEVFTKWFNTDELLARIECN